MDISAQEFGNIRKCLCEQVDSEILGLKNFLSGVNEDELAYDLELCSEAIKRIFLAYKGLERVSSVLNFIDAMEEGGGNCPRLNTVGESVAQFRKEGADI